MDPNVQLRSMVDPVLTLMPSPCLQQRLKKKRNSGLDM